MSGPLALAPAAESVPFHPIADCWPLIDGDDFALLADDIRAHGLIEPITLYEGAILDGRNRYRACQIADVAIRFVTYDGADPVAFAKSKNDARRHLTSGQRAMVASKLANLSAGGDRKGDQTAFMQFVPQPVTIADAAKRMGVSERSVANARAVQSSGVPEIVAKVERGELPVTTAAEIVRQPVDRQREVASWSPKDIVREAGDLRRARVEQKLGAAIDDLAAAKQTAAAITEALRPSDEPQPEPSAQHLKDRTNAYITFNLQEIEKFLGQMPEPETAVANFPIGHLHTFTHERLARMADWLTRFAAAWVEQEGARHVAAE